MNLFAPDRGCVQGTSRSVYATKGVPEEFEALRRADVLRLVLRTQPRSSLGFMAPMRVRSWRLRLSMNLKVGRAVLCAPTAATTLSNSAKNGAHGATRPTSPNWFMVPMCVQS